MTMYYLVGYVVHPTTAELRHLRHFFGNEFQGSVLPAVSPPIDSAGEAAERLQQVQTLNLDRQEQDVLLQPSEEEIPRMSEQMALQLVKRDLAWARFLEDFGPEERICLRVREYPRCWIVVATALSAQIPPGEAFIVDKYSQRIFPRRYVDLISVVLREV